MCEEEPSYSNSVRSEMFIVAGCLLSENSEGVICGWLPRFMKSVNSRWKLYMSLLRSSQNQGFVVYKHFIPIGIKRKAG